MIIRFLHYFTLTEVGWDCIWSGCGSQIQKKLYQYKFGNVVPYILVFPSDFQCAKVCLTNLQLSSFNIKFQLDQLTFLCIVCSEYLLNFNISPDKRWKAEQSYQTAKTLKNNGTSKKDVTYLFYHVTKFLTRQGFLLNKIPRYFMRKFWYLRIITSLHKITI